MKHLTVNCLPYTGTECLVCKLRSLIAANYSHLFTSVVVHGSVATDEVIEYSDFDGLIIIKDQYVNSEELNKFRKESLKLIYKFDPLQHHGWFEIQESDLNNYPQTYLPYELFKYSRLVYPNTTITLDLCLNENVDYLAPFERLSSAISSKIKTGFDDFTFFKD